MDHLVALFHCFHCFFLVFSHQSGIRNCECDRRGWRLVLKGGGEINCSILMTGEVDEVQKMLDFDQQVYFYMLIIYVLLFY